MLAGIACKESPHLTIDGPSRVELSQDGNGTIAFSVNREWTASSSDAWLSVSPQKGMASDVPVILKLQAGSNASYEDREATVTIQAGEVSQTVTVIQAANRGVVIPVKNFDLSLDAQPLEVEVLANASFKVDISVDWIKHVSTRGLSSKHLVFSILENDTYERREGTIAFVLEDGTLYDLVFVRQEGRIAVSSVELDKTSLVLRENQTAVLTVSVSPEDATDKSVIWNTSDAGVVTVDERGSISAVREGSAMVTAQAGGLSAVCEVFVTPEGNIVFADPVIKGILVNRFDTDGDGELSYEEAGAVTSFSDLGTHADVTSFDEFRYFTGLEKIPGRCFMYWSGLKSIVIPHSVTGIEYSAFDKCTSLSSITLPKHLKGIEVATFSGCTSLKEITIPDSVQFIWREAFKGCSSLVSVDLPKALLTLGDNAFNGCTSLTSIHIPNNVTEIGKSAFSGCVNLTSAILPGGLSELSEWLFSKCAKLSSVYLPASITKIGSYAFEDCSSLTSMAIPEGVESIEGSAFYGCSGLTSLTFPNTLTYLGMYAFTGCSGLTSITLPISLHAINQNDFQGCTGLKSVILPKNLQYISANAFMSCTSLESITIPFTLIEMGARVFKNCTSLSSVTFEDTDGLRQINVETFCGCSALTSINIPDSVETILDGAFTGCSSLPSIKLPDRLTLIYREAFKNCRSLVSVMLPDQLTGIGYRAFFDCSSLSDISFPESLQGIGSQAFYGCIGLDRVTIPEGLTLLGDSTFRGCTGLHRVTLLCPNPPKTQSPFLDIDEIEIYVPSGSLSRYRNAEGWREYASWMKEM